jgi:hypothetical protein
MLAYDSRQATLQALKGDLKTVIPYSKGEQLGVDLTFVIKAIDKLRNSEFPENCQGRWATLELQSTVLVTNQNRCIDGIHTANLAT